MIIVIPARGGSKRIPHKNIHPLGGKPLLEYTLDMLRDISYPVYLSTDDESVASVARRYTAVNIVMRPTELASDNASTESVLLHVIDQLPTPPEWVMTLPPTSPFRGIATIQRFIGAVKEQPDAQDCLMSITENRGDFWQLQEDGFLQRLFPHAPRRQQDRTPLFEENSAIYLTKISALRTTNCILGKYVRGIAISPIEAFDINIPGDLQMAECILAKGLAN